MLNIDTIYFFWEGHIHPTRLKILQDCLYSTRVFNPNRKICLFSNTITKDMLDARYDIIIFRWTNEMFKGLPIPYEHLEKHYLHTSPRELSDLMRFILLYKYGGTYIDTDDLAIKPISDTKNIVCRSYDPHTSFYNKITDEQCIDGKHREIRGYDNIPMFPRNDCWHNFEPNSNFLLQLLSNPKITSVDKAIYIGDNFSWQSLTHETIQANIDKIGVEFNFALTLLYLYEDFVAGSSYWDRCMYGGEMCDLWKEMPNVDSMEWGSYKCNRDTALSLYNKIVDRYPHLSHLWLHSKDMKQEWLLPELTDELYSPSTWILNEVRNKIHAF